jgi:hypothetical protein
VNTHAGSAIWTPWTTLLGVVTQLLGSNAAAALAGIGPAAAHPIDSAAALTSAATTRRV